MSRKTSQQRFEETFRDNEWGLTYSPDEVNVSVGTSPQRYNPRPPQSAIDAGWEKGKKGCTISYSNFTGATYWVKVPALRIVASNGYRSQSSAAFLEDGKFHSGRVAGGHEGSLSEILASAVKLSPTAVAGREAEYRASLIAGARTRLNEARSDARLAIQEVRRARQQMVQALGGMVGLEVRLYVEGVTAASVYRAEALTKIELYWMAKVKLFREIG